MLPEIEQFQKWLRRKYPHTSTFLHYTSDLQFFFTWAAKPPGQVSVRDVDAYIERSQTRGHSLATINRRLAALGAFYHFLDLEAEDAPACPVIPRRHYIPQGETLPRDVEDHVLENLFAVMTHPRDQAMFLLMLRCGLRVGEVRNLSLNDLYLQPNPGALPRLWLHGKGGKQRVAYLSRQPLAALQAWLAVRPKVQEQAVFLNRFGSRMSVTGIQDRLAHYCRQAGVWVTCHQFRHTFGRHLTEARVPVTTLQRLLGHALLKTTEVYLHISDQQLQADYEAAITEVVKRLPLGGGAR